MRKLYLGKGIVDVEEFKKLAIDTYELMNGVINPVNRSQEISFVEDIDVHNADTAKVINKKAGAIAHLNSIQITTGVFSSSEFKRTVKMLSLGGLNNSYANKLLVTYTVDTVLHELSHLDQDFIAYTQVSNTDYGIVRSLNIDKMESANAWYTKEFIDSHKKELEKALDVKLDYSIPAFIQPYYLLKKEIYVPITSISDITNYIIFTVWNGLTLKDLEEDIKRHGVLSINVGTDPENLPNITNPEGIFLFDKLINMSFKKYTVTLPQITENKILFGVLKEVENINDYPFLIQPINEYYLPVTQ